MLRPNKMLCTAVILCSQLSVALRFRNRPLEFILIGSAPPQEFFYFIWGFYFFTFLTQFAFIELLCCYLLQ